MVLAGFVGGFGWFWLVLGVFGWFRVLVTTLSTNTVVLKQGKLQHAAVYIIKFRMTSLYK